MIYYLVRLLYFFMNKSFFYLVLSKLLNYGECKFSVYLSVDFVNVL